MVELGGLINGLRNMAAELGVKPEVLGIMSQTAKSMSNKKGGMSREYAMQSSLEFIPCLLYTSDAADD